MTMTMTMTKPHPMDALVRLLTGWLNVEAMRQNIVQHPSYRPTCRVDLDERYTQIADLFDAEAAALGMPQRAYRPVYDTPRLPLVCVIAACESETGDEEQLLCRKHRNAARRALKAA
jgi:hypothetical protein